MSEATITSYLFRIQTDPNASEDPTATAIYGDRVTVNGVEFRNDLAAEVSWRLHDTKEVTFTAGGVTYTLPYYVVSAGVTAIADQEKASGV